MGPEELTTQMALNSEPLERVNEVEYLGKSIKYMGLTDTRQTERIEKEKCIIRTLNSIGVNHKRIKPSAARNICNMFAYPVSTYGIHVVPPSENLKKKWRELNIAALKLIREYYTPRHERKLEKIAQLLSLKELCGIRLQRLERRLEKKRRDKY